MWGDVTPAERLRAIARRGSGDDLAAEAAAALSGYADDPASLVVACRRLMAHHPAAAPLAWVCSRMLTSGDPRSEAALVIRRLRDDPTGDRLAAVLPLLDEHARVAAVGWCRAIAEAAEIRLDLPVLSIRTQGTDPVADLRRHRPDRTVRVLDVWEPAPGPVAVLLVPAAAAGPERVLVAAGLDEAVDLVQPDERWLVVAEGRALPGVLFDRIAGARDGELAVVGLEHFDRAVGPRATGEVVEITGRPDCGVAPELLRA